MISLNKDGQSHAISLSKGEDLIVAKAFWNTSADLDLRVSVLDAKGEVHYFDGNNAPRLDAAPFIQHMGDVQSGTDGGMEEMRLSPKKMAEHFGGKCAVVFSVYSAVDNGPVSVATMAPTMTVSGGGETVECDLKAQAGAAAQQSNVYTYVVGMVTVEGDTVTVQAVDLASEPGSEQTPWPTWNGQSPSVQIGGPGVTKNAGRLVLMNKYPGMKLGGGFMGMGGSRATFANL